MDYEQVLFETRGKVGVITLNRPDRLNAWSAQMNYEVRDAITRCNEDTGVGAIVVTGAGRAYCSGADLGAPAASPPPEHVVEAGKESWLEFLARMPKPIICAINGAAVGFGMTHTLPFDIRIAAEGARIGFTFGKVGLVPEVASSHLLPRLVGHGRALEWCLTGRFILAPEAKETGLVSEVVPAEELLDRAVALAEETTALAPPSVALIKQLFRKNATETDLSRVLARESAALTAVRATWESKEAMTAFMEKRAPDFTTQPASETPDLG